MSDFLSTLGINLITLGALVAAIAAVGFMARLWYLRKSKPFEWTDLKYGFPLFGKIRRAVYERNLESGDDGLTPAERSLMADYQSDMPATDRLSFKRAYEFLLHAKQADRSKAPDWGFPALLFLLACEAFGFAVLIVPSVSNMMTPFISEIISPIVALLIGVLGVWFTHNAGKQAYERGLIRRMRREADDEKVRIYEQPIQISEDQDKDVTSHTATRFGNRVLQSTSHKAPKMFIVLAALYILGISGVSFYLRYYNLELLQTQQSAVQATGMLGEGDPFGALGTGASPLPPEVERAKIENQNAVRSQEATYEFMSGLSGIIALGVIFVFTQIMSATIGFLYGPIDRGRVRDAFDETRGYSSFEQFERHELTPKIARVNKRLTQLRKGLFHDTGKRPSSMQFEDWLDGQAARRSSRQERMRAGYSLS